MVKFKRKKKRKPEFGETSEAVMKYRKRRGLRLVFQDSQDNLMLVGGFLGLALITAAGLLNPASRVRSIYITGNRHLSDAYVCNAAGVNEDSLFYLCPYPLLRARLCKDPMIAEAKVDMVEGNILRIDVTEKKAVGYRGDENLTILFEDQTTAEMQADYMGIVADIPYINGFEDYEQQRRLVTALSSLEPDVISDISEITQYALPYDNESMQILMDTGGYVLAGYDTVDMLKNYRQVYAKQVNHSQCLYAQYRDDSKSVLVSSACPWDAQAGDREYWKDEEGNIVTNKYGDQVVKKYYMLSDGKYAEDAEGNRIPIPIDREGMEVIDEDFQANFDRGYYASGTLELPEQAE